jgi:hypothetical protein
MNDEEVLAFWIDKHKAKVYQNTKASDNRSCDIDCGHKWKVVIPNPDANNEKDSLVGCADTVLEAASALNKVLFCSKNFEIIFCSDMCDYRNELKHQCDGFYCGAREQYEYMEKKFSKDKNI